MPPKAKPAASTSHIYVVVNNNGVDSVFATPTSANERAAAMKTGAADASTIRVEVHDLKGGSVQPDAVVEEKPAAPKAKTEAPKASTATKTKSVEEQRAAKAEKASKATDEDLPDNVKALLAGSGQALSGLTIVVTGVPPMLGRKLTEKLVTDYGGKLTKSLSKNTSFVVVGNDAGPTKLDKIADLDITTLDEDAFIEMLEGGGSGTKRAAEQEEKPAKAKKQKK